MKIPILFAILLVVCAFFNGCTSVQQSTLNNNDYNNINDIYGREVQIPKHVNSIAIVGSAARLATYAGCADKIVAITEMDKPNAMRPYTISNEEKFRDLPTTSNGNHINATDVDAERLIDISPDIILSTRPQSECQKLYEQTKIPVVGVYSQDELFDGKLYDSIKIIGNVCNCSDSANATIQFLDECKGELSEFSNNSNSIKTYRGAINYKGTKGLTGTISHYPIYEILKITNVAQKEEINTNYDTTIEDIISTNPNYIFIDCQNYDKVKQEYINYENLLNNCEAFNNDNIYSVAPFNNNGTNVEYALCEAYYTANITGLANINLEQKFEKIYKQLLGKNIYNEVTKLGITFEKAKLK